MSISGLLDRYLIRTHLTYAAQPLQKLQARLEELDAKEVDFAALKGAQRDAVVEPLWQLIGRAATAARGAMDHIDDIKHVNDVTREAIVAARGQAISGWGELLKAVSDDPLPPVQDPADPTVNQPFSTKVMLERVKRAAELVDIAMKSTPLTHPAPDGFTTETAASAIDMIHQIEARPLPGVPVQDDPTPATPPSDEPQQPSPAAPPDDQKPATPPDDQKPATPPSDDGSEPGKPATPPADDGTPPAPTNPPADDGANKPAPFVSSIDGTGPVNQPADDGGTQAKPPADDGAQPAPATPPVANHDPHTVPPAEPEPAPTGSMNPTAPAGDANAPAPFVAAIDGVGPVNQPAEEAVHAATPPATPTAQSAPAPSAFKAPTPPPMRPGR